MRLAGNAARFEDELVPTPFKNFTMNIEHMCLLTVCGDAGRTTSRMARSSSMEASGDPARELDWLRITSD
ncbi:hypothetical protein IZ6_00110 [Terrihabitans soli]|uniref:Uncharacterized protein n=1 Tax=Terrihabitans soli TaxID=708113 RepID=A0A6S6QJA6_9HYPH|nr:hypothetical protein IZ6_00110 [Terrihabitans soli]